MLYDSPFFLDPFANGIPCLQRLLISRLLQRFKTNLANYFK